jgi:RNA polymerase sigma-70 factor (ECF subfamily)
MHTRALKDPNFTAADADALELMRAVQRGERAAFEKLSHRYYADLHSLLSWLTPRPDRVDDLACEVLLSCWNRAAGFQLESSTRTWLWKLAYPVIIREAAAAAAQPHLERDRSRRASSRSARRDDVSRALLMLPIEERTTLVLAFHMRCSCDEIATITQSSADIVSDRLQRALLALRGVLTCATPSVALS